MRLGAVFPQLEIGADPAVIREYAQAVEQAGYLHLLAYDHVLGANPDRPGGWRGPYNHESLFHEPLTTRPVISHNVCAGPPAISIFLTFCPS